jgi:hypothetical protein
MPALFAYLVAIGLLLGGGYGALTWLAAPEPLKVVIKARPKQAPRQPAGSEGRPDVEQPKTDSMAANDGEHATIGASRPSTPSAPDAVAPARQAASTEQPVENKPPADAATSPTKVNRTSQSVRKVSTSGQTIELMRISRPPRPRRFNDRPAPRKLALMTLRTIEFADGHRVTQLLPYRNSAHALASEADDLVTNR